MATIIADLHIHSRFSLATSREMEVDTLNRWAKWKGIGLLGTGDFTHPEHVSDLKKKLQPAESGLFRLKRDSDSTRFLLTAEVCNIFRQDGRTRKIHTLLFAPNFRTVAKINRALSKFGKIQSNGRPIFTFPVRDLAEIVLNASESCMVIPAHAWTPWFSVFGARSGFDTLEEAYGDFVSQIHAVETGLSSDPAMNRRVSMLDNLALISNSDAHSPIKLGREANVFDCELDYFEITDVLKSNDRKRFVKTIEFFPEHGKYHLGGHRKCGVRMTPGQSGENGHLCPVCGKPLTLGVMHRVDELAERGEDYWSPGAVPFIRMVPLTDILSEALGVGSQTKTVRKVYHRLIESIGSEFRILLDIPVEELMAFAPPSVCRGIQKVRAGDLRIEPGFDGQFGRVSIF